MQQLFKLSEAGLTASTSAKSSEQRHVNNKVEELEVGYHRSMERVNTARDDDCWFLRASVAGLLVEWLMDCGANPNLLSIKVFERIPENNRPILKPLHTRLIAANGEQIVTYGQTVIDLYLDGAIFSAAVIIADIGDMN